MTTACRKYLLKAVQLSEALIQLAQEGSGACEDDQCLVLFGIILDTGSKIRREAENRLKKPDL